MVLKKKLRNNKGIKIFNGNFSKSFFLKLIRHLIKCKDEKEFFEIEDFTDKILLQLLFLLNKNELAIPIQFSIFYTQNSGIIQNIKVELVL
jgi:uncharacterized protein YihD (DUF1040 family)